jgi:hypothetical protein
MYGLLPSHLLDFFIFLKFDSQFEELYRYDFVTVGSDAPRPDYFGELQLLVSLCAESIFVSKIIEIFSVCRTVIRFVWVGAKFGTCIAVSVNG